MTQMHNGRPGAGAAGETVGQTTGSVPPIGLAVAGLTAAACGGIHEGPCDRWSVCTGMDLTVEERAIAGAAHPWRAAA
ncbi:hypothetical protein HDA31_004329 [Micromonospora carbonacea subsp. aurantiaca]|nr:hypothetical protein [Micromonospora carbonacea]